MSALSHGIGARSSVSRVERAVHYQSAFFTVMNRMIPTWREMLYR